MLSAFSVRSLSTPQLILRLVVLSCPSENYLCCKVAVVFLAVYARRWIAFCSNDCVSREMVLYSVGSVRCSGRIRIHNPKIGGSIPPPLTKILDSALYKSSRDAEQSPCVTLVQLV